MDSDYADHYMVTLYLKKPVRIDELESLIADGVIFSPNDTLTNHYVVHENIDVVHELEKEPADGTIYSLNDMLADQYGASPDNDIVHDIG